MNEWRTDPIIDMWVSNGECPSESASYRRWSGTQAFEYDVARRRLMGGGGGGGGSDEPTRLTQEPIDGRTSYRFKDNTSICMKRSEKALSNLESNDCPSG